MAQRIETIVQHVFAFDASEIAVILKCLNECGATDLADEIEEEMQEEHPF